VIYRSDKGVHPGFRANFRIFDAVDFVAEVCGLLPDAWRHETVAYGAYANVVRGRRERMGEDPGIEILDPDARRVRKAWRDLIEHIYEVDRLRAGDADRLDHRPARRDRTHPLPRPLPPRHVAAADEAAQAAAGADRALSATASQADEVEDSRLPRTLLRPLPGAAVERGELLAGSRTLGRVRPGPGDARGMRTRPITMPR